MGRIDRMTQDQDIFMYLLCYNFKGKLINIEQKYFEKLEKKVKITNDYYSEIDEKRKKNMGGKPSDYYELPKIIPFNELDAFEDKLPKYLDSFQHIYRGSKKLYDELGSSIDEVRMRMIQNTNQYLHYTNMLSQYPWYITFKHIENYIIGYYTRKLSGHDMYKLLPSVNDNLSYNYYKPTYDKSYPIIYDKNIWYTATVNNRLIRILVRYILGKRTTGKYDILMINLDKEKDTPSLLNAIKNNGITDISLIISSNVSTVITEINEIKKIYQMIKVEPCMTSIFDNVINKFSVKDEIEIDNVNNILKMESKESAEMLCQNIIDNKESKKYIYKRLSRYLSYIPTSFRYKPDTRAVIGTTNIIQYIGFDTQILLNNYYFIDKKEVYKFISIVSQKILDYGVSIIPTWDKLIKPVKIK